MNRIAYALEQIGKSPDGSSWMSLVEIRSMMRAMGLRAPASYIRSHLLSAFRQRTFDAPRVFVRKCGKGDREVFLLSMDPTPLAPKFSCGHPDPNPTTPEARLALNALNQNIEQLRRQEAVIEQELSGLHAERQACIRELVDKADRVGCRLTQIGPEVWRIEVCVPWSRVTAVMKAVFD